MRLLHRATTISCPRVTTLSWDGEELVDVTSTLRVKLDGTVSRITWSAGYSFDRAVGVRQGDILWSVAYTNRATKGILMKNGTIHRELNRSFNFADVYDYPLTLTVEPAGRVVVVHCPNSFDTLEVEDAETGMILATKKTPDMEFHSRLAVSGDGRYLLDAGWFWHPLGGAWVCDLAALLRPGHAIDDGRQSAADCAFSFGAEIDSAAILGNDEIVVASTEEVVSRDIPATGIGPRKLGVWSMAKREWRSMTDLTEPAGTIMPWREWVISFHECPKAIDIASGAIVYRWDGLYSGKQIGSIELGDPAPPPMAFDSQNGRFAVAGPDGITVVTLATG